MLVARRPISIGSVSFKTGDRITREAQNQLPPGRMPQLIEHGWIEELVDEIALDRRVECLEKALDDLRTQVAKLAGNKTKPRRTRATKAQDEEEISEEADEDEAEAPAEVAPPEEVPEEVPETPAEAEPEEPEAPAEDEPTSEEPEPEVAPAEDEPVEIPQPEAAPATEEPPVAKVWDPIDCCWKSEDELVAATEARAKSRRRAPAKTKARG